MPKISEFYGIIIAMYFDEEAYKLPHFHAKYAGQEAVFGIESLEVLEGKLPKTAIRLIQTWAALHQSALLQNYQRMQAGQTWQKIEPLE